MKRNIIIRIICILLMAAAAGTAFSSSAVSARLAVMEWSWTPGDVATFEGSVSGYSGDALLLRLSVSCKPASDDFGKIVFSSVNEKKLTVRNQKEKYSVQDAGSGEVRFTGSWYLPDSKRFSQAVVSLKVYSPAGEPLAETALPVGKDRETGGGSVLTFPDLERWILYISGAGLFIWILAAARILINRKRRI